MLVNFLKIKNLNQSLEGEAKSSQEQGQINPQPFKEENTPLSIALVVSL